jgi:hypothetical protein
MTRASRIGSYQSRKGGKASIVNPRGNIVCLSDAHNNATDRTHSCKSIFFTVNEDWERMNDRITYTSGDSPILDLLRGSVSVKFQGVKT